MNVADPVGAGRARLTPTAVLESVRTYEGTDEVHTLITGRATTGIPAFAPGSRS